MTSSEKGYELRYIGEVYLYLRSTSRHLYKMANCIKFYLSEGQTIGVFSAQQYAWGVRISYQDSSTEVSKNPRSQKISW